MIEAALKRLNAMKRLEATTLSEYYSILDLLKRMHVKTRRTRGSPSGVGEKFMWFEGRLPKDSDLVGIRKLQDNIQKTLRGKEGYKVDYDRIKTEGTIRLYHPKTRINVELFYTGKLAGTVYAFVTIKT